MLPPSYSLFVDENEKLILRPNSENNQSLLPSLPKNQEDIFNIVDETPSSSGINKDKGLNID